MSNVIAIVNHKGGTGKSTTAINLAAGLTRYSDVTSSCLVIDMDPHGCATSTLLGKLDGAPPAGGALDVLGAVVSEEGSVAVVGAAAEELLAEAPGSPTMSGLSVAQLMNVVPAASCRSTTTPGSGG